MNKELTGTNIEITNAGERQLSSFQMEGKSVQNGTPEPNVPVEIESAGYENLFDVKYSSNYGFTYTYESGVYTLKPNVTNPSITFKLTKPILAGSYYYSGKLASEIQLVQFRNSKDVFITSVTGDSYFTSAEDIYYIRYSFNAKVNELITLDFNGTQLAKEKHAYIPHGKYGIEVETTGTNKFNALLIPSSSNIIVSSDGSKITMPLNTVDNGYTPTRKKLSELAPELKVGDTVYLTFETSYNTINQFIYLIAAEMLWYTNTSKKITQEILDSEVILYGNRYSGGETEQLVISNFRIVLGESDKPYQPYQKNKYTYVLDEPLRSLPNDPCDLLLIENNKLYVDRYIGEIILNGSETWFSYTTGGANGYVYYTIIDDSIVGLNKSLCSHFKNVSFAWDVGDIGDFSDHPTLKYKYFVTDKPTITEFKTWLEQNPIHVVYERETPVNQKLGDVDMPTTTYGTNYITTNTDIQPRLAIEYFEGFSDEDKQAIKNGTVAIKSRIIVNTEPQMVLTENDSIKDWEYCDERYVPQQGFIGQFVARTLSGNLQDISDDFNIENHEIELQLGVVEMSSGEETWYSFGNFLVTSPEGDEVTDNTKFEAMDYTKKFNVDFNGNYTSENFPESYNAIVAVDEITGEPKGHVTALWLARYTCEQAGVPFGQNTFTNADYIIDFNPYQAGESCRDVMKDIAKLAFSWVRVDVDNKCYIDFKESSEDYGDEYNVFTNDEYYSLETKKEIYGPINRIYIGMSNIDGESIIVAEDKEDIELNGEKALYIYDNQLTYSPELRALIADNHSADKLLGLTYTHLTTETIGHPWLNGKEFISVIGMEDNECKTYPFNRIIKFNGHIKSTLDSMGESEVEATLGYESDVVKNAKNAMVIVKKHEGEIELLATDVTDVKDNIKDNYYTKQETNNTILNATSGLTNIYTSAGGNNRFRNTGLHFEEADGFEYWDGSVEVIAEINSATQTAMLLQNGSISQTVSNLPNGKYTISFKYEELIESSSAYVLINSTRYDLAGSGTFKQTIDVNTNNIEIDFNCDTNGGFKIYELMGNVGETALVWTQHPDEIMTDTVNISKGITITSSSKKNVVFKAGADGIKIENKSKNTTTEFLENGMSTNDAEIKGQAKISGSLFTKVGNQTWISGL